MRIDRKVMDRIEGEGMTLVQIAAIEGVSRAMVWQILQNAYRKLKRTPRAIEALRAAQREAEARRARVRTWADEESD